jgi:hypothetical protein
MMQQVSFEVAELIMRSNRLGSDRRNTNYADGDTSAKGTAADPAPGQPVRPLWVKGSPGTRPPLPRTGVAGRPPPGRAPGSRRNPPTGVTTGTPLCASLGTVGQ